MRKRYSGNEKSFLQFSLRQTEASTMFRGKCANFLKLETRIIVASLGNKTAVKHNMNVHERKTCKLKNKFAQSVFAANFLCKAKDNAPHMCHTRSLSLHGCMCVCVCVVYGFYNYFYFVVVAVVVAVPGT